MQKQRVQELDLLLSHLVQISLQLLVFVALVNLSLNYLVLDFYLILESFELRVLVMDELLQKPLSRLVFLTGVQHTEQLIIKAVGDEILHEVFQHLGGPRRRPEILSRVGHFEVLL